MDKVKLSFWELFTYFLIGIEIIIILIVGILIETEINLIAISKIIKDFNALILVFLPFISLILGMMLEPISNEVSKILEKCRFLRPREARGLEYILPSVKNFLPIDLSEQGRYRFCKAVVEQRCPSNSIPVFLARFGFYRSSSTLVLIALLYLLAFYPFTLKFATIELSLMILTVVLFKRSQIFKGHMEYEAYYNFVAYRETLLITSDDNA
ncbi:MAG: hypothetical protein ACRCVU_01290 [Flavobacterium sp.]